MDFWTVISSRRSIRAFDQGREVEDDLVRRLLHGAIAAPSAGNRQPWHFVVARDAGVRTALAAAAWGQRFVAEAPVVIVVCAEPARSASRYGQRGVELYCLQDTAAAAEHLLLGATACGLGACWVGAFDEAAAVDALRLPRGLRPVAIVPIGHPVAEGRVRSSRRPLGEVTTWLE